jgi:hypothetical protein
VALIVTCCALGSCKRPDGENGPVTEPFADPQAVGLGVVLTDHQVQVGTAALDRGLEVAAVHDYAVRLVARMAEARDQLLAVAAAQQIAVDQSTAEAQANVHDTSIDIGNHQNDAQYLADSVHDVGKALEIWDNTILPSVTNAALQTELEATRQLLADELAVGKEILALTGIPAKD